MMVVKAPPFREAPPTKKPSMLGCCPDQRRPDPSFSWRFASFHKKGTSCCSTNYQNEISPMPKSIEVSRKRTTANFKQNHMLLLVTAFSSPPNMFIFHQLRPLNLSSFDEIIQPHPSIFDRFTFRLQSPRHRVPRRSCRSQSHHTGYARTRWPAGWHRGLKPLDTSHCKQWFMWGKGFVQVISHKRNCHFYHFRHLLRDVVGQPLSDVGMGLLCLSSDILREQV